MSTEALEARLLALETLVRETRESQARMETLLGERSAPGSAQTCRWHAAQMTALEEFDTDIQQRLEVLEKQRVSEAASAATWARIRTFALSAAGAALALAGQYLVSKI